MLGIQDQLLAGFPFFARGRIDDHQAHTVGGARLQTFRGYLGFGCRRRVDRLAFRRRPRRGVLLPGQLVVGSTGDGRKLDRNLRLSQQEERNTGDHDDRVCECERMTHTRGKPNEYEYEHESIACRLISQILSSGT